MHLALELASRATILTSPNPKVGCVIVKDELVLGQGWTQAVGQAHAEVMALRDAISLGHDVRGATAYVTLEPCSHYGRTPPCANSLIEAGLSRVVAAVEDAIHKWQVVDFLCCKKLGSQFRTVCWQKKRAR